MKTKYNYEELKKKKDITIEDINNSCFTIRETKPQIYYIIESPRKKPKELKITDLRREFPMLSIFDCWHFVLKFGKFFNPIKAKSTTLEKLRLTRIELNNAYTIEELNKLPIKINDDIETYGISKELIDYDIRLLYALIHDKRTDEHHKSLCINFIGARYPAFFYFDEFGAHDYINNYGPLGHKPSKFNMFKSNFISTYIDDTRDEQDFPGNFHFWIHDCYYFHLFSQISK